MPYSRAKGTMASVLFDKDTLRAVDQLVEEGAYRSRSKAIAEITKESLLQRGVQIHHEMESTKTVSP